MASARLFLLIAETLRTLIVLINLLVQINQRCDRLMESLFSTMVIKCTENTHTWWQWHQNKGNNSCTAG